ncbi:conserved domain protein [Actinomyces sp. oral taxon 175 str. F0384]|nr:conserved domain protein [Actinomyces sp. oral taxon 175 str. F0384]
MRKQDAQAGDVPFMDGLGHSPVVPHPRQSQPASSYRVAATTASDRATSPA